MRDKRRCTKLRLAKSSMSSPPVIAIIGRPNVGKSTLFNRLTGGRTALVSDMPGLTRDRREGEADLAGNAVTIVDTAGLEDAKRGSIAERMRQQSEAALGAADLVLFVIDAREGITSDDKSFAQAGALVGAARSCSSPTRARAARPRKASTRPSSSASASRSPFRPSTARASAISKPRCWRRSG